MEKILMKILKILFGTILLSIVVLFFTFSVFKNLFTYSPYYAKQLNEKGEHREIIFLIENLSFVNKPYDNECFYDYENLNAIIKNEYMVCASRLNEQTYILYENYKVDGNHRYLFDDKLNLIAIKNVENGVKDESVTKIVEIEVKKRLLKDIQPILKMQDKPNINLQWLFDYLYEYDTYCLFSDLML